VDRIEKLTSIGASPSRGTLVSNASPWASNISARREERSFVVRRRLSPLPTNISILQLAPKTMYPTGPSAALCTVLDKYK
jgi:hypothetical protein